MSGLKFWGIASIKGLESFEIDLVSGPSGFFGSLVYGGEESKKKKEDMEKNRTISFMVAYWARSDKAVMYEAIVPSDEAKEIEGEMARDPKRALRLLKEKADDIKIAETPHAKEFWEEITR